ncbi:NAD-dependent epimerase/dehydratase family protein [Streptomyces sp. YU58]|uniref:NAD-dependent epimerase/dehydratase family protein n=1 Tax=Streptomyces sp. SX92 TaxID=3158972 RepID=UPI0027B9BB6A|nr:NAD-dependent epimerase/dehydratase family protein [Streptomyces coralus]WLW55618.1 NAD-dependent epimerase/dehydratase family protein [Streptomyces coralus]
MRLLLLGGTEFVGRAVAEAALGRGWDVTVFHRGRHAPPAGVRSLHGDRTAPDGLAALAGTGGEEGREGRGEGGWDAVVDTWSAAPHVVRDAARLLRGRAGRYVYVSSSSVYTWPRAVGADEDAPVVEGAAADAGQTDYARDKRGGELAAVESFGADRSLLVRAGLILGPYENIGRLPWWLNRIARGGPVLASGPRDLPLQYIDVRDLAEWILDGVERGSSGPYNLVGPPGHATMGTLLDACMRATGSTADLRWTDPDAILDAGIEPWLHLPVWLPPASEAYGALHTADISRALATGLRTRPVDQTVTDTWTWLQTLAGTAPHRPDRPEVGLDPDLETRVLTETQGTR